MPNIQLRRFPGILVCTVVLVMMLLLTACAGTGSGTGQPTIGTTATTTSATQGVPPTATQPPAPAVTTVAFKAGGISFIGPVKSITSSSLVMSAPNGQTFTMAINAQTDLTAFSGSLPAVGASVNMDSAINPDGSLTATILKPAQAGDPDLNVIAYTSITTNAVGADRNVHFKDRVQSYLLPLSRSAAPSDCGGGGHD